MAANIGKVSIHASPRFVIMNTTQADMEALHKYLVQRKKKQREEEISVIKTDAHKREIPAILTSGGLNAKIKNPVYRRVTPVIAQWEIGRSHLRVHKGDQEGLGKKKKD